jgi:hypothetical protein
LAKNPINKQGNDPSAGLPGIVPMANNKLDMAQLFNTEYLGFPRNSGKHINGII